MEIKMKEKKIYEKPKIEIIDIHGVDIVTCSPPKICDGSCGTTLPDIPFTFSSLPSF